MGGALTSIARTTNVVPAKASVRLLGRERLDILIGVSIILSTPFLSIGLGYMTEKKKTLCLKFRFRQTNHLNVLQGPSLGVLNKLAAVNVPECNFSIRLAALETDVTVVNST